MGHEPIYQDIMQFSTEFKFAFCLIGRFYARDVNIV